MRTQRYELASAEEAFDGPEEAVPVPPAWVREEAELPARFMYAALADSLEEHYMKGLFEAAREYLFSFPEQLAKGQGVLFTGASGRGKTYTAAALVNEIKRVWGHEKHIRTMWLPVASSLRRLFDYKHFRQRDEYYDLRQRIFTADLLVVDDLTHAAEHPETKEFLFSLYDHRDQNKLPVITTANVDVSESWEGLEEIFNQPFVRRLRQRCAGFTVSV